MIIKSFTYIENISISLQFLNNTRVMCQGFVVYLAWLLLINVRIHDLITSQLCCKLHYRLRKTMTWLYSDLNSQPYTFVTNNEMASVTQRPTQQRGHLQEYAKIPIHVTHIFAMLWFLLQMMYCVSSIFVEYHTNFQ